MFIVLSTETVYTYVRNSTTGEYHYYEHEECLDGILFDKSLVLDSFAKGAKGENYIRNGGTSCVEDQGCVKVVT